MTTRFRPLVALIVTALLSASASAQPSDARREFVTSYWYGPPRELTTLERYKQIRDANFNVVFPPGPPDRALTVADNRKILDFCRELGMRAVIFDPRMPTSLATPNAKANIDAIVADYASHPALMAYFVTDEPGANDFAALGEVVAYLKRRDPQHPGFVNLFPNCADARTQLQTDSYEQYLARFLKTVDPFVLSYDHYPFLKSGDRPEYFMNLALARNAVAGTDRPLWVINQCVQHYDYRVLTEPEFRFQAMQALAFGCRGLLWYTYWYPGPKIPTVNHAMIAHDGTPDPTYAWIAAVNADARAIGDELTEAKSWATFHTGPGGRFAPPLAPHLSPIDADPASTAPLTIGVLRARSGKTFALVANREYRKAVDAAVIIRSDRASVQQFSPADRKWSDTTTLRFTLPPGGATLLRW